MSALNTGRLVRKRVARIFLALIFFTLTFICSASAFAAEREYIDESGKTQTVDAANVTTCSAISSGWYYVSDNPLTCMGLTINDEVHLIIGGSIRVMNLPLSINQGGTLNLYSATNLQTSAKLQVVSAITINNGILNIKSIPIFLAAGLPTSIDGGTIKIEQGTIMGDNFPEIKIRFNKINNATFSLPNKTALESDGQPPIISGTGINLEGLDGTITYNLKNKETFTITFKLPAGLSVESGGIAVIRNTPIEKNKGDSSSYTITPENGWRFKNNISPTIMPSDEPDKYSLTPNGQEYTVQINGIEKNIIVTFHEQDLEKYTYAIENGGWTYNKDTGIMSDTFFINSSSAEVKSISLKRSYRSISLSNTDYDIDDPVICDPPTESGKCHTMTLKEDYLKTLENGKYELTINFTNGTSAKATFTIESNSDPKPTPTPTPTPDPTPTPPEPIEPVDPIEPVPGPVTPSTDPSNTDISAPNTGHQPIKKSEDAAATTTFSPQQSSAQITMTSLILPLLISALFCAAASCRFE